MIRIKKIKFLLSALMLITQVINATGTLKGRITDKEKNIPLIGANILLENTNIGAGTDTEGNFLLTGIIPGNYNIVISMIGYKNKVISIQIKDNQIVYLNESLLPSVLQLADVTVIGLAKRNLLVNPKIESAGLELSTTIVTQQEIQQQGAKNIVEALNFVPGALIETRGRKIKKFFSVRGQVYPYPEYSINGVWQREFLETSYFYPINDIEKIEVIRSSAALLTGINGMAGVVNIIPREYNSPETSLLLEYGTFGTYRTSVSNGSKLGDISYATGIGIEHTNGPSNLHAKENMLNFNGNIKWTPTQDMTVRYYLFHISGKRELRLAEPPASKRFLTELGSYDPIRSTLTNLKIDYKFTKNSNTELLIYYTKRDPVYNNEDEITNTKTQYKESDWEWGTNLIHSVKLTQHNTLRIGGLYNHWVAPNGKRFYLGRKNDLETISFVAVDEQNFGVLNLNVGIRNAQTFINEYGGFGINGSGKKFKKVEPLKNVWQSPVIQTNFGGAYLLPKFYSVNFNISYGKIKPLPGSLDINLQEPKNETRIKLDLGIRKIWNSVGQLSLIGFFVNRKNAIVLSGTAYNSPNRYMELYLNRDQNQYGIEFESISSKLWNSTEIFFNTTLMKSYFEINNKTIENFELPKMISSAGMYYQKNHFDISLLLKYVSSFKNKRFAKKELPPQPLGNFILLNSKIGWNFYSKLYSTKLYLEIYNIMDNHYSTVVGYPDFGRRFNIGIRQIIK